MLVEVFDKGGFNLNYLDFSEIKKKFPEKVKRC